MDTAPRSTATTVALLAAIVVAATTSVLLRPTADAVSTWWPAAGLSVALLARSARRQWPLLLVAVAVITAGTTFLGGRPLSFGVPMGLANALEALVAARVLVHGLRPGQVRRLEVPEDWFRVLLAAVLGATVMGAGTALTMLLTGGPAWESARAVAPSHLAAILVIVPLALMPTCLHGLRARSSEVAAQVVLFAAAAAVVFGASWPLALSVLPLPVLIWAALRLPAFLTTLEVAALTVVATAATTLGRGPFAVGSGGLLDPLLAGAHVQLYLVCTALLAAPTALASAQRAELTRRLAAEREVSATTLDTTSAIIFVTDAAGTILQCNATLTRLTGFTPAQVLGRSFWDLELIPRERTDTVRAIFAPDDGQGVPAVREADVLTTDGERLRVVWSNNVVRDEHGRVSRVVCTATDVTSERSTSGLVRHLLEAPVATALVALDEQGRVVLLNHGAEELLGRCEAELVLQPVSAVVDSAHPYSFIDGTGSTSSGPPATHDWVWRHADGTQLVVSTTISVVTNVVGKVTGYLCVGRDVTEQRRTHAMLVAALRKERHVVERLRSLDEVKNDFVSTVSHELRTPTTSIVGYTEMLREGAAGAVSPGQEVMLDAIARNGDRLIAVANDLLTLASLEGGDTSTWAREPVDLVGVVAASREALHPLLAERALDVDFEISWGEVVVTGDAAHLDRVVTNLLSNAVKFTPDGGEVRCRLSRDEDHAILEVADTGIGIPEEEQGELFTKFFRSSTSQERAIQGTGLGLSIIHSIVTAHGGRIEVRSAHLAGTTFTVRLPLAAQQQSAGGARTEAVGGPRRAEAPTGTVNRPRGPESDRWREPARRVVP